MGTSAVVISCSDRALDDVTEDRSGAVLRQGLAQLGFEVGPPVIVPSDTESIRAEIIRAIENGARIVVTAGGTGLLPRDVTAEATAPLLDYELPGIMEEVRRIGAQKTPLSLLSRGLVGVCSLENHPRAFVVNAPGSRGGARDTLAVLGPIVGRVVASLDGVDHDLSRPASQ